MKKTVHAFIFGLATTCLSTITHAQYWQLRDAPLVGKSPGSGFGSAVSLSSDGLTFAASGTNNSDAGANTGYTRVYTWNGTNWIQKGEDIEGISPGERSGHDIALSGDGNTLVIGIPYNNDLGEEFGKVRVYAWDGSEWLQKGTDFNGEHAEDKLGYAVDINYDGAVIIIGASTADYTAFDSGLAQVYLWNGSAWETKGPLFTGTGEFDSYGGDVSIDASGNRILFSSLIDNGEAHIYQWQDEAWVSVGQIIYAPTNILNFGYSVDLSEDGQFLVIGAIQNLTQPILAGKTYVYRWNDTSWALKGNPLTGNQPQERSGRSVSISAHGDAIVIGSPENDAPEEYTGKARIYNWDGNSWELTGEFVGEGQDDYFGDRVSINADGTVVAMGSSGNDGGGLNTGHARVYEAEDAAIHQAQQALFELYPNPASESVQLTVPGTAEKRIITVTNACGQVMSRTQSDDEEAIVLQLPQESGTYFVTVQTTGFTATEKVVKL